MVRIAHATDIHWFVPPGFSQRLLSKRLLGSANLYLRGRRKHFDSAVQLALVEHLDALDVDAVVITGDLTAQALPEEFELARTVMRPVLDETPTLVQCGNHDVYTGGSSRAGRLEEWFGSWMHLDAHRPVARLDVGPVTVLGLDPNRPHWSASGRVPEAQLARLTELLDSEDLQGRPVVLAMHYPLVDKRGDLYDGAGHGLRNAGALKSVLEAARNKPVAVIHGHRHHGYRVEVPLGQDHVMHSFDPGSGGYAWLPDEDRAACMNVYNIDEDGSIEVERFRYDGERFAPEEGGAYATGR